MTAYITGEVILLHDVILYASNRGRVVFIIEDDQYSAPFPKQEWEYLKKGIGLQMNDSTVYVLDKSDEDLRLIERGVLEENAGK